MSFFVTTTMTKSIYFFYFLVALDIIFVSLSWSPANLDMATYVNLSVPSQVDNTKRLLRSAKILGNLNAVSNFYLCHDSIDHPAKLEILFKLERTNISLNFVAVDRSRHQGFDSWIQLMCISLVAHYKFMNKVTNNYVLYLDSHYVITRSLEFLIQPGSSKFHCLQGDLKINGNAQSQLSLCNSSLLILHTSIGSSVHNLLQTIMYQNSLSIDFNTIFDEKYSMLLSLISSRLSNGITIIPTSGFVMRAHQHWYNIPETPDLPALIEFDGDNHQLYFQDCLLNVFVKVRILGLINI